MIYHCAPLLYSRIVNLARALLHLLPSLGVSPQRFLLFDYYSVCHLENETKKRKSIKEKLLAKMVLRKRNGKNERERERIKERKRNGKFTVLCIRRRTSRAVINILRESFTEAQSHISFLSQMLYKYLKKFPSEDG